MSPNEPAREKAVAVSQRELEESVSVLEKEVGQLEDSMGSILRSNPPSEDAAKPEAAAEPACELARTIDDETHRIKAVSRQLKSITSRLEA